MDPVKKFGDLLVKMFGSRNARVVESMLDAVEAVNRFEPLMQKLSDKALSAKTQEFRNRLSDAFHGRLNEASREEIDVVLNELLPEAFAVVREASQRVVRTPSQVDPQPMRHFDVQLIGGMVLHRGAISEMATGEGKTLVATLAAYLNALPQRGVHIVTVNDYLARRDRDWMGPLYQFLGLTSGAIQNQQGYEEKRAAYACDITFGKDSEFGFDYLRDNMRWSAVEQVQRRGLYYAIVDEVDSVLIDEARTPLIISGPSEESTDKYYIADRVARRLQKEQHFIIKEKEKSTHLTEEGVVAAEKALGVDSIYTGRNAEWPHHIEQSLRAHHLYKRDVEYVAKQGEIIIVDEFTGRLMPGRRWSDGLHQAIEAKEGLKIAGEDQTLATVTYQNFFRLYKKLAGMTGTAMTEATEFAKIYRLDVINIPTNRPLLRVENPDLVYRTEPEKFKAIVEEVVEQHATGRPVLVGTISIEKSEHLSDMLNRRGVKHEVLNAKHHEREAQIVAQAGQMGHVTIATNMAGRGTDIVLGGFEREELIEHWKKNDLAPKELHAGLSREEMERQLTEFWAKKFLDAKTLEKTSREEWRTALERVWADNRMPSLQIGGSVADLGGLHIVGTERHEARRIDNQLRGRSGRQGDPGSSRFFLSLQDDLMRIFASERVSSILQRIGMEEGMAIEHGMVTRSIERAQKKVEEHNFEIRKHLLEYDEIMDEQRKAIYSLRQKVLEQETLKDIILGMIDDTLQDDLDEYVPTDMPAVDRNGRSFCDWAKKMGVEIAPQDWQAEDRNAIKERFLKAKSAGWASVEEASRECVENTVNLLCDAEAPFYRWNFQALSRWARHHGLVAEATALHGAFMKRIVGLIEEAARERHAGASVDGVVDLAVEQAMDTYISGAVAMEEWDLRGLEAWTKVADVTLPVSQWMREAEQQSQEGLDTLSTQTTVVRDQLRERLARGLRNRQPAEFLSKLAIHEFERHVAAAVGAEKPEALGRILSGIDKSLGAGVLESSATAEIQAQKEEIKSNLSEQLVRKLSERPAEAGMRFCSDDMVEMFLVLDLAVKERNLFGLSEILMRKYGVSLDPFDLSKLDVTALGETCMSKIREAYDRREEQVGSPRMRLVERYLLLQKIDVKWKDHLLAMDHLKGGIGLRGYAQVDPKVEYTREARILFDQMRASVRQEVTDLVLRLEMGGPSAAAEGEAAPAAGPSDVWGGARASHPSSTRTATGEAAGIRKQQDAAIAGTQRSERPEPIKTRQAVGRNDPCPCGSGKKYKKCCGKAGAA
jgi:preprotein translocase subunit SecA